MTDLDLVKTWLSERNGIQIHIKDILKINMTAEIRDILINYDFQLDLRVYNSGFLDKIVELYQKCLKFDSYLLYTEKTKVLGPKGKVNINIVDVTTPIKFIDGRICSLLAKVYEKKGDRYNTYRFYVEALNKGQEVEDKVFYYAEQLTKDNFIKVDECVNETVNRFEKETDGKKSSMKTYQQGIKKVTEYAHSIVDRYTHYMKGSGNISSGPIEFLEGAFSGYLKAIIGENEIENPSQYVSSLSTGVDGLLKNVFYMPYIRFLDKSLKNEPNNQDIQHSIIQLVKEINVSTRKDVVEIEKKLKQDDATDEDVDTMNLLLSNSIQPLFDYYFTMGTFETISKQKCFIEYLKSINYSSELSEIDLEEKLKSDLEKFKDEIDRLKTFFRNPVAHSVYFEEWKLKYLINEVLLKEDNIMSQLIKLASYEEYIPWFEDLYNRLAAYKERNGHLNIKYNEKDLDGYPLGQKICYIKSGSIKLSKELNDQLLNLGLNLESKPKEFNFEDFYNRLVAYKERNGHLNIKSREEDMDGYPLGRHVARIRQGSTVKLTAEQRQKLIDIGADFGEPSMIWFEIFFDKLFDYKLKHGNFKGIEQDQKFKEDIKYIEMIKDYNKPMNLVKKVCIDHEIRYRFACKFTPKMQKMLKSIGIIDYLYSNTKKPDDDGFTV